jgi:hypothetical protein
MHKYSLSCHQRFKTIIFNGVLNLHGYPMKGKRNRTISSALILLQNNKPLHHIYPMSVGNLSSESSSTTTHTTTKFTTWILYLSSPNSSFPSPTSLLFSFTVHQSTDLNGLFKRFTNLKLPQPQKHRSWQILLTSLLITLYSACWGYICFIYKWM